MSNRIRDRALRIDNGFSDGQTMKLKALRLGLPRMPFEKVREVLKEFNNCSTCYEGKAIGHLVVTDLVIMITKMKASKYKTIFTIKEWDSIRDSKKNIILSGEEKNWRKEIKSLLDLMI